MKCRPVVAFATNRRVAGPAAAIGIWVRIVECLPVDACVTPTCGKMSFKQHLGRYDVRSPVAPRRVSRRRVISLDQSTSSMMHRCPLVASRRVSQRDALREENACHRHDDDQAPPSHEIFSHQWSRDDKRTLQPRHHLKKVLRLRYSSRPEKTRVQFWTSPAALREVGVSCFSVPHLWREAPEGRSPGSRHGRINKGSPGGPAVIEMHLQRAGSAGQGRWRPLHLPCEAAGKACVDGIPALPGCSLPSGRPLPADRASGDMIAQRTGAGGSVPAIGPVLSRGFPEGRADHRAPMRARRSAHADRKI